MKNIWFRFTVSGRGAFPVDMLRYDRCYPYDSQSAAEILEPRERRTVMLCTLRESYGQGLTVARWESFGWIVQIQKVLEGDEDITHLFVNYEEQ